MAVPQWITDLRTRRDNITAELADMDNTGSRTKPGAKPDTSGDGGGTEGTAYRTSLLDELTKINATLKDAAATIAAEGAIDENPIYEIITEVS